MKVLAVGDIHCKLDIIDKVWQVVDNYNAVIFVGDYADDWGKTPMDTINTWQKLKEFQEAHPSKVSVVTGNHDYIYVHDTPSSQGGYSSGTQFMIDLPDYKELKEWIKNMPIAVIEDGITYSHAGYTADFYQKDQVENEPQDLWGDDSPIWVRPITPNYSSKRQYIPKQVFGHTPSETCWEVEPSVWCIDTFSTYPDGTPVGDQTVLEIVDGKKFEIKRLDEIKNDNHNNTDGI